MSGTWMIPARHSERRLKICELREILKKVRELWQFTRLIRSKNAGPFELTFDIMFKDEKSFREVMESGKISAELIAQLYKVELNQVRFFVIESLLTLKISIPRPVFSGNVNDTDVYGGQFHGPLVRLMVGAE
jgi:hypothetical protein